MTAPLPRTLLTGIAIAALAIGSASAKPGGGNGGGNDHGNGKGGDGGAPAMQAGGGNSAGGGHGAMKGPGPKADKSADRGPITRADNPGKGPGWKATGVDHKPDHGMKVEHGNAGAAKADAGMAGDVRDPRSVVRDDQRERVAWRSYDQSRGLIDGCPPGLAKKNNGCMPPGLAKQQNYWGTSGDWWNLRSNASLSDYRYYNGSMVRLDDAGRIVSYYPLLGGSLIPGASWPTMFSPSPLPTYYQDFYGLGNDYRYVDGAIYRLDPTTQAIQSVAALLTGDQFAVGQPLPVGYSAYNVPYAYRDQYADGPGGMYRYSDGYVYQVDPTTQLITAAIKLLT